MSMVCKNMALIRKCGHLLNSLKTEKAHSGLFSMKRNFATSYGCMAEVTTSKEVKIPIPYGHIAAKVWGPETGIRVLAFHGWLDNAGTFDRLIPQLSPKLCVVAFDAPGHGLSSHRPPGSFYSYMEMIIDFKRVVDFLGWEKYNIIGHSMGGSLAQLYASIFNEAVEKIVVLDIYKVTSRDPEKLPELARNVINENLKLEKKCYGNPPLYNFETAAKRLRKGMYNEITEESAKILLKRGTRPSDCGNGVIFTRDLRSRTVEAFQKPSHDAVKAFMTQLKCEMLMIMSKNTHPQYQSNVPEIVPQFLDIYKKYCKKFVLVKVEGNHFVHLNNPESIAPYINQFLCPDA